MNVQTNLIDQLTGALVHSDIGRRAEMLRRVTDLFVAGSGTFVGEQISLFDDVMSRLLEELEVSARAIFGQRMAVVPDAPPRVIRGLALDDAIEVAGPILSHSERLDDTTLLEGAKTKSQNHLLAISRRKTLAEPVTDVLVERGERTVAVSVAENTGARFSDFGYGTLVERAQGDRGLALTVWARPEIPRQHMLALFEQASESVRRQLAAADPAKAGLLRGMIAQAANRIQTDIRERSAAYAAARAHVHSLHRSGKLNEAQLADLARSGKFDEATVALSIMADLPIGLVERALTSRRTEQILVFAKAIDLGWETAKAILLLQAGTKGSSTSELDQCCETFARLQPDTAKKVIHFYRLREKAGPSD
jgi:uncharacterized protein (DUF2336 family)